MSSFSIVHQRKCCLPESLGATTIHGLLNLSIVLIFKNFHIFPHMPGCSKQRVVQKVVHRVNIGSIKSIKIGEVQ